MSKTKEAPIAVEVRSFGNVDAFVPCDAWAAEEMSKLPKGVRFHAQIMIAKSSVDDEHGRLLTKYMAGISQLYDWLPITGPGTDFPTANHVRKEILKQIGFCENHPQRDGSVRKEALSMQRDKMSFEDLEICFEITRLYVAAWTEALTGTRWDPWEKWELEHPPVPQ